MSPKPLRVAVVAPAILEGGPATHAARHTVQILAADPSFAVAHFGAVCGLHSVEHHPCRDGADLLIHPAYLRTDVAIFVAGPPHPLFDALFGADQVRKIVRFGDVAWSDWSGSQLDRLRPASMIWVADPAGAEMLHVRQFDPGRIHLVPVPPCFDHPAGRLQGKPGTPLQLLAAGPNGPDDGCGGLVDAMARLEGTCGPVRLTIAAIGPPADRDGLHRLRQRIAEDGLGHAIQVLDRAGAAERHVLLHQAHALVLPGRQESSAARLLEALRAGCIPIFTGSLNRTLAAGGLGMILPASDTDELASAIARLARALPGAQDAPGEPLLPLDRGATSIQAFDRMAQRHAAFSPEAEDGCLQRLLLPSRHLPAEQGTPPERVPRAERPSHAWIDLGDTVGRPNRVLPALPAFAIGPALQTAAAWCTNEAPALTVVIVSRNEAAVVRQCVRHVLANTAGLPYEIVIVDDGSDAAEIARLTDLGPGIRLLPLGTTRHDGEAINIAAEQAGGRYLCLLDRNAFVQPGWLAPLLAAMDAGAAAAAPLFPDAGAFGLWAGGSVDALGHRVAVAHLPARRHARLHPGRFLGRSLPVECLPASCLLIGRSLFLAAGGFDLSYEPGGYGDIDLCFRLRALGHVVLLCPHSQVVRLVPAAGPDAGDAARRAALDNINRRKFVSRWGPALRAPSAASLATAAGPLLPLAPVPAPATARTAILWTPYRLTPGGGERYLLSLAAILAADHAVTIVTPHPYSQLRLDQLGRLFEIDLTSCRTATHEASLAMPPPDTMVTLGNQITPPTPARTADSLYICQFPFPEQVADRRRSRATLAGYRAILAYSRYARAHIDAALHAQAFDPIPIEVVYPPVPQLAGCAARKRRIILSTGRFFAGGHNKRHDAMIEAFRSLLDRTGDVELHLAGSSLPDPHNIDHLARLQRSAEGFPIVFHVNASQQALSALYEDAMIYWHAAGLGADLAASPGLAEHFGISIVEAMSAQCVPVAFDAAGPREIITHAVDGFLFSSEAELLETTAALLEPTAAARRAALGQAAMQRAERFSHAAFAARVRSVIERNGPT